MVEGQADYRVLGLVPVANEDGEVSSWLRERHGNQRSAEDPDATEATGRLVESRGWEVEEASDLILHLEVVREVLARWDRAGGSVHPVLVGVLPHLDPIPVISRQVLRLNRLLQ